VCRPSLFEVQARILLDVGLGNASPEEIFWVEIKLRRVHVVLGSEG
jgi:hypothetical protein